MPERIEILDVPIDALGGMEESLAAVEALIERADGPCRSVLAVNPEKIMAARSDPTLLEALIAAGLLIPDGIGAVLAARFAGHRHVRRVPGVELMGALCARAAERGWSVFLLGARPEVNEEAAARLQATLPALTIAGRRHGYFTEEEEPRIIEEINDSRAQILFIALGSPKQELWLNRHLDALQPRICQGVGGSFDVVAGRVRRAPAVFRRIHAEWLYRLLSQPKRLMRQTAIPRFVWQVGRRKLFRQS